MTFIIIFISSIAMMFGLLGLNDFLNGEKTDDNKAAMAFGTFGLIFFVWVSIAYNCTKFELITGKPLEVLEKQKDDGTILQYVWDNDYIVDLNFHTKKIYPKGTKLIKKYYAGKWSYGLYFFDSNSFWDYYKEEK